MDTHSLANLAERLGRVERSNRFWKGAALAAAVVAGWPAVGGLIWHREATAQQQQAPGGDDTGPENHVKLAKARLEVSKRALEMLRQTAARGVVVTNLREDLYRWSYRMLGDQIYLSMADTDPRVADPEVYLAVSKARANADRVAAFEGHVNRMRDWEALMRKLYDDRVLSPIDFLDIQSYRLEAELWLSRERFKEQQEAEAEQKARRGGE